MPPDQEQRPSTGVTWRRSSREASPSPPRDPRIGSVIIVGALVAGVAALAWALGWGPFGGGAPTERPSASPTLLSPIGTPSSTATPAPPTATPRPTATQGPSATPSPTATAGLASPTPEATPGPGTGIRIDFPADGETVVSRVINVIGTGPVGATITRDIPFWFDDHTNVREDGLWMLRVELNVGSNELAFRIGDDRSTERRFIVIYAPDGR
jgi:hypothetical protein